MANTYVHFPPGEAVPGVQKHLVVKIHLFQWRTKVMREIGDFSPKYESGA